MQTTKTTKTSAADLLQSAQEHARHELAHRMLEHVHRAAEAGPPSDAHQAILIFYPRDPVGGSAMANHLRIHSASPEPITTWITLHDRDAVDETSYLDIYDSDCGETTVIVLAFEGTTTAIYDSHRKRLDMHAWCETWSLETRKALGLPLVRNCGRREVPASAPTAPATSLAPAPETSRVIVCTPSDVCTLIKVRDYRGRTAETFNFAGVRWIEEAEATKANDAKRFRLDRAIGLGLIIAQGEGDERRLFPAPGIDVQRWPSLLRATIEIIDATQTQPGIDGWNISRSFKKGAAWLEEHVKPAVEAGLLRVEGERFYPIEQRIHVGVQTSAQPAQAPAVH